MDKNIESDVDMRTDDEIILKRQEKNFAIQLKKYAEISSGARFCCFDINMHFFCLGISNLVRIAAQIDIFRENN